MDMGFKETYTTNEKKTEDEKKPEKEQTEKGKISLSNDAYAISEMVEQLINELRRISSLIIK